MMLREAAERLGVSPTTLRLQIRNGKLRAVKRGRDWHVTPSEVDRYGREHGRKVNRCPARHPYYVNIRCDAETGHPGEHFDNHTLNHWDDPEPERCTNRSCVAGCRDRKT